MCFPRPTLVAHIVRTFVIWSIEGLNAIYGDGFVDGDLTPVIRARVLWCKISCCVGPFDMYTMFAERALSAVS